MSTTKRLSEEKSLAKIGPIATPNQSIDAINKVVSVLFSYKRPAMYKDVALAANLHQMTVSQALSASRDMGLTRSAGKKGLYVLTSEGQEYARLLTAGKENEAKSLLHDLLERLPTWKEVMVFLKAIRGEARDPIDLILDVERKLNKNWSRQQRSRLADCFSSILIYADFVRKKGGKIFSLLDEQAVSEEPEKEEPQLFEPSEYALLQTDDFRFEIRKKPEVLEFARTQFLAWLNYLKKKIKDEENR